VGKTRRHIIASGLLFIYSFALVLVCNFGYAQNSQAQALQKDETENYQSIVTGNQPGAALIVSKLADRLSPINTAYKKTFQDFSELLKSIERLFTGLFTRYEFISTGIAVRLRKADIIFPFQYFW
jgi:hypothetical protein